MNGEPPQKIFFAEFELDMARRVLRRAGEPLPLYAKTFDLLAFLMENNGRAVSKDEILEKVWAGQFVEEANLSVQISALRKALGETKNAPRFLITIPGKGYKFVADLRVPENSEAERKEEGKTNDSVIQKPKSEIIQVPRPKHKTRYFSPSPRLYISLSTGAIVVIIFIAATGYWFISQRPNNQNNAPVTAGERQPKIKRLTNHGRTDTAVLSPDGKFFAYTFVERGSLRSELRLAQTDGGGETVLNSLAETRFFPKVFSSDGTWLYYITSEPRETVGSLYKTPVLRSVPQKLADNVNIWLALSPDEKQIAFVRHNRENKTSELVVADLNGMNQRAIVVRSAEKHLVEDDLAWSPDGRLIAFGAANGVSRRDASKKSYEVFVARAADGAVEQLTALEWNALDALEWFKDGSGLLAVAQDADRIFEYQLWQIDYPGGKASLFSRDAHTYGGKLCLSADSVNLLVIQRELETNIWIAPAGNIKEARQITFSSSGRADGWYGMSFTPDGRIVHTAWIDQSLTIWIMDALGANPRQLTSIGFRDEKPVVTTNGQTIVFQSNRSGATEIWRMDIDGGNLRQVTSGGGNSNPSVTPDGKWVVYRKANKEGNSIWRVSLEGGEEVRITDRESFLPSISPDGKFVACAYVVDGKTKLAVVSIEGGEPVKLFNVPKTRNFRYDIRWSPDGKFINYPDEANGIWQQSIKGGEPMRLKGVPEEKTFSFDWSPDSKQFAFGRVREIRDVILISDFR